MPDNAYPPLQTLRHHPNDAPRCYAEAVDSDMPYEACHFNCAADATEDAIFAQIQAAAKTHQVVAFTVTVNAPTSSAYPQDVLDVRRRAQAVLRAIAPDLHLWFLNHGGTVGLRESQYTETFRIWLYDRHEEGIPKSVEDVAREALFMSQVGDLFEKAAPVTKH